MSEYALHKQVADYLRLAYPHVLFRSDHSGVKVHMGTAIKMKALQPSEPYNTGFPDLFIIAPRGGHAGLFIELKKKELVGVYTNGSRKGEGKYSRGTPSKEQLFWNSYLNSNGFVAVFCYGFEDTIKTIDTYLMG